MKTLYPEIEPYDHGYLEVGGNHRIYWETSGNPDGAPMVFLHGGPGSGSSPWQRQLYNPDKYRIILFDQRGSGKSSPHASLENNTTSHLVDDMEKIREHLAVDKWHVSGGSWGSTLALAYADKHADRLKSISMYGIFLCRKQELQDLYFDGGIASRVFPEIFYEYLALLPEEDRADPIVGYGKLFASKDEKLRTAAIDKWTRLEKRVSALVVSQESLNSEMSNPDFVISHSLVEQHYFKNYGFVDGDKILDSVPEKLENIPVHIIQGRYDMVCPFKTAWELRNALKNCTFHEIPAAGHTAKEPQTTAKLVDVFDSL